MAILILGDRDDEHAAAVLSRLKASDFDAELWDSRDFPADMTISFDPLSGQGALGLPTGRSLLFEQIQSVYWRTYDGVEVVDLPNPEQTWLAMNDSRSLFESLFLRLPARWVNGWEAYRLHQTKPAQLAMVAEQGIRVPDTRLTNCPAEVHDFVAHHSRVIFKPVQGGAHARRLTEEHVTDEHLRYLQLAPITLQEEIVGTNIRAFVAGERVLACEINTNEVDFRDDEAPELKPHVLSSAMIERCQAIARTLQLLWTGIDFRRTPAGDYVFLEANPSPMFLGFEEATGLPLMDSLVEVLTEER
ncbi:MAG: hypothetical protein KDA59_18795 [Planctomycetales bacterium]|nr:hypothetical protein [Planctomycetales bacterium]MCA9205111.1 hypothetical protein [Planctomycetales bacterium]MCA9224598.1 hypothetical protein [Planctomycetales bacterium]